MRSQLENYTYRAATRAFSVLHHINWHAWSHNFSNLQRTDVTLSFSKLSQPQTAEGALFLWVLFVRSHPTVDHPEVSSTHFHPQLHLTTIYPHCLEVREGSSTLPWWWCEARKTGCTWSSGAGLEHWDCPIEMELRETQCLLQTVIDEGNHLVHHSNCQGLGWLEMLLRFWESNTSLDKLMVHTREQQRTGVL